MSRGTASGREIADHIAVPFGMLQRAVASIEDQPIRRSIEGAAQFGDYLYQLTDSGVETAGRYLQQCGYDGPAPIALQDYVKSVHAQSIHRNPPTWTRLPRSSAIWF